MDVKSEKYGQTQLKARFMWVAVHITLTYSSELRRPAGDKTYIKTCKDSRSQAGQIEHVGISASADDLKDHKAHTSPYDPSKG